MRKKYFIVGWPVQNVLPKDGQVVTRTLPSRPNNLVAVNQTFVDSRYPLLSAVATHLHREFGLTFAGTDYQEPNFELEFGDILICVVTLDVTSGIFLMVEYRVLE